MNSTASKAQIKINIINVYSSAKLPSRYIY